MAFLLFLLGIPFFFLLGTYDGAFEDTIKFVSCWGIIICMFGSVYSLVVLILSPFVTWFQVTGAAAGKYLDEDK